MSDFEKKKLDNAFRDFTLRNFEDPADCRNIDQLRFYVSELCIKISEYERRFNFVPDWAYDLLTEYNSEQNRLVYLDFKKAYC